MELLSNRSSSLPSQSEMRPAADGARGDCPTETENGPEVVRPVRLGESSRLAARLELLDLGDQLGDRLLPVGDQAVVGDLEDRLVRVLVDRDDRLASPSCRRGAGWRPRSRPRCRGSARRSCRSGRPASRPGPCRRRWRRATRPSRRRADRRAARATLKFSPFFMPRPPETTTLASPRSGRSLFCASSVTNSAPSASIAPAGGRRRRVPARAGLAARLELGLADGAPR